jgi:2-polyprenyl-6-methoxyphenol hydroxylase-like FAD-dependent oxidoreductase
MSSEKTSVLIVGAGPVGLTLAIALGRRGIDCVIAETKDRPAHLPKMERCNARTMEHFRRLGIADRVRAAGLPSHVPMDVYVTTSIAAEPILHLPYPSPEEARKLAADCNDASMPLESQQLVSQYSLEPVLREVAESLPSVTVRYSCEVTSFEQDESGVTAVLSTAGDIDVLRAHFLVGCDGGASTVRRAVGCKLEGQGDIARLCQVFFRSNELIERIPRAGQARHFYIADEDPRMIGTAIVVQSDQRHFTLHTSLPEDTDFVPVIQRVVGMLVDVEVLAVNSWSLHLLLADRYGDRRVFLAGDAAHLVIPQGGLGMNTGIGDAMDLEWKLAGTIQGWGGPGLLDSYEVERRQVGARNLRASEYAARGTATWREASNSSINDDTDAGRAVRARVRELADIHQRKGHEMLGIECGYRYLDSPIVCYGDVRDDGFSYSYEPRFEPGYRLPHAWLADGSSLHDHLGSGFTLLKLGSQNLDTRDLEEAFSRNGVPLKVVEAKEDRLRETYGNNLFVLRPDLHIAWSSTVPPVDADALVSSLAGHPTSVRAAV